MTAGMLVVFFLDHPYANENSSIVPTEMRRTLTGRRSRRGRPAVRRAWHPTFLGPLVTIWCNRVGNRSLTRGYATSARKILL